METFTPRSGAPDASSKQRRSILKWSSAALLGALAYGTKLPHLGFDSAFAQGGAVDLGAGDVGVLNYAYALEQLEAAFYTEVVRSPYAGMTEDERRILTDIRDHEIVHREFFRDALGANAIPGLEVNFSAIDFNSRTSVLTTAQTFEDLGVSAYNGGGRYIQNPDYLLAAGKIVSVEARHAAIIRDLMNPRSTLFAGDDVVNAAGLDVARKPSEVLPLAAPFITTRVTARRLP